MEIDLHGHSLMHDDNDHHGYEYLAHKIGADESKMFFQQAKEHGSAEFKTNLNKDYILTHNSNGTYTVAKK